MPSMSRHRSRSPSRSPHRHRGDSRHYHHRGDNRHHPHRRDGRHYHHRYSPRNRHHSSYNTSNYSNSDRTHPGYSSTTGYVHSQHRPSANYSVPSTDRPHVASSRTDSQLRNNYFDIPVRMPDIGPPPQNDFGSRFQGSHQKTNEPQNSNNQQHTWLNPAPPVLCNNTWPPLLAQQQQQQQLGIGPPLALQQCEKDVDLAHVMMTQLPFLEKVTNLLIRKIPADRSIWTTCSFAVDKSLLQVFKGIHATSFQIQLRFCNLVEGVEQKDYFPSDLQIKLNGHPCPLPGWNIVPKQPAKPVEITSKCDFYRNMNTLQVKSGTSVVMFAEVMRRLSHEEVLQKLLRENSIDPAATVARIKEKLEEDSVNEADITLTSLQFSLMCPVSKTRMKLPCRASTCLHLQCFDAAYYLKMNEKKPTWRCPICSEVIQYKTLQIDMHFKNILEQNISTEKVLLQIDGSCTPFKPKEVDTSILTLDDTLDQTPPPEEEEYDSFGGMEPPPFTHNELDFTEGGEAHHITIDLLSEDESEELPEQMPADHAFSKDSQQQQQQQQQVPELVTLSDDETPDRPKRRASLRRSIQKVFTEQEAFATPTSKQHKRKAKKKTPKTTTTTTTTTTTITSDSPRPRRIGLPGTRMVLRSHARTSKAKK